MCGGLFHTITNGVGDVVKGMWETGMYWGGETNRPKCPCHPSPKGKYINYTLALFSSSNVLKIAKAGLPRILVRFGLLE